MILRSWRLVARRAAIATLILGLTSIVGSPARGDEIEREAAIHALYGRMDFALSRRLLDEKLAELRQTWPTLLLDDAGKQAELGPAWARGNRQWDRALRLIEGAVAAEEARSGPIFAVRRIDIERSIDPPWSEDDVRFIGENLDTTMGRSLIRLVDATFVFGFLELPARPPDRDLPANEAIIRWDDAARAQLGDASLALVADARSDPARMDRLNRLFESARASSSAPRLFIEPSMRRFFAAVAQVGPQLQAIVDEAKAGR